MAQTQRIQIEDKNSNYFIVKILCNLFKRLTTGYQKREAKELLIFFEIKVTRKEKNMALDTNVGNILTQQINKEFYSAYLYLTFADFYEEQGLKGFANWYVIQSQEELAHARILRRYLLDNDWTPTMEAIAKPDLTFSKVVEPIKAAYEHEQFITASINECYAVAQKVNDFRTMQLLDWYVKEQGEEEANAADLLKAVELFGGDPKNLFDLDRENAARVFVAPTMPM